MRVELPEGWSLHCTLERLINRGQVAFPTVRYSDSSIFRQFDIPTVRYSESWTNNVNLPNIPKIKENFLQ